MKHSALTDLIIRQAKPGNARYILCDGDGLNIEIMPSGSKIWRLRYAEDGHEHCLSLGPYPAVSLSEARAKRDELKKGRVHGIAPADALHATHCQTFRDIATEWIEKQSGHWVPRHAATVRQKMEAWLFPSIGDRPLDEITAPELLAVLRLIEDKGLIDTAKRARQIFSLVARYGVAIGACGFDVSAALAGALKPCSVKPMAALTGIEDIRRLVLAMEGYRGSQVVRTALWFSLYTLARPGEVRHAEWKEIDIERAAWTIPEEKMKRRKPHAVPLCRRAVELLEELYPKTGRGRYVFPSARSPKGTEPMSNNAVRTALRRMGFSNDEMTAHGFRSLGSTRLNEMGFRPDVIEAALSHTRGGVRGIYNRSDYWEERVDMMEKWSAWISSLTEA